MRRKFTDISHFDEAIDELQDEIQTLRKRAEDRRADGHKEMRAATCTSDKDYAQTIFDEADRIDKQADRRVRKSKKLGEAKAAFLTMPLPFSLLT